METWTYLYSSGKLSEIADYGRKLVLRYYSGGSFDNLLYRVGDHSFDDSNPHSPTGRYIEYSYTLNKVDNGSGGVINGTAGLLTEVQDVRGNTWTHRYYGSIPSETNINLLNFIVERLSPVVDTTGDGNIDGPLTLENLIYTVQNAEVATIRQERGNATLITDFAFQPNENNITLETAAGRKRIHLFDNGVS